MNVEVMSMDEKERKERERKDFPELRAEAEEFAANRAATTYVVENLDYKERGPLPGAHDGRGVLTRIADTLDRIEADLDGIQRCLRK